MNCDSFQPFVPDYPNQFIPPLDVFPEPSPEMIALAEKVLSRIDTRTEEQIIADGVAFVMNTDFGGE
jgi:hypothetical protein